MQFNLKFLSFFKALHWSAPLEQRVQLALLYESYRRQPITQMAAVFSFSTMLSTLFYFSPINKLFIVWVIPLYLSFLWNYYSYRQFTKAKPGLAEMPRWEKRYFHQCWMGALVWNVAVWPLVDKIGNSLQALWFTYYISVGFSSIVYLYANKRGIIFFLIILFLPSSVRFYMQGEGNKLISYIVLCSLCFMIFQANEMYKTFCALIQARHTEEEARNRAEIANAYKSQFLANVSHEIRTPMTAVLGMLQLLQTTPLSVRQEDYATKAETAAQSLLTLINEVLDFSKIEAEKLILEKHSFNLIALLDEIHSILTVNLSKPIALRFLIDPSIPPLLLGDPMRLRQVLLNLAGNAIKFTNHGKVTVSVTSLGFNEHGFLLKFMVKDTGIGISKENSELIFEEFTQADASTSRHFGGTGLGLAICKSLVKMMGGTIELDSEEGRGSLFYFSIRLQVATDTPQPSV
jgi:signal transduction histidine kinase